jgi:phage terminase small subunit
MKTNAADFLTPKQRKFCDEYLIDMNASRAALRAGYSASTALNGSLMAMPKIKLYLQQQTEEIAQKVQVNSDMVLRELCKIAFGNMGNYFLPDGKLKPMHQLTDDEKAALWNVTVNDVGEMKIRMYNKLSALDKIAKYLNFYKPEEKKPEIRYVYLDKDDMTEDDWFDDEEENENQELGDKMQNEEKPKDNPYDDKWYEEEEVQTDEEFNQLLGIDKNGETMPETEPEQVPGASIEALPEKPAATVRRHIPFGKWKRAEEEKWVKQGLGRGRYSY